MSKLHESSVNYMISKMLIYAVKCIHDILLCYIGNEKKSYHITQTVGVQHTASYQISQSSKSLSSISMVHCCLYSSSNYMPDHFTVVL